MPCGHSADPESEHVLLRCPSLQQEEGSKDEAYCGLGPPKTNCEAVQ